MALKSAFGTEAAASYLNELLSTPTYADLWRLEAQKPREGEVSQAAVSRVLAGYLVLWSRVQADFDQRSLKDLVNRALTGRASIAHESFELFAAAFGFSPKQIDYWFNVRNENGKRPRDSTQAFHEKWPVIPLPYQTTLVTEIQYVSPSELTSRRHGLQEIQANGTKKVSRVQLRILDSEEPSVSAEGAKVIDVRRIIGQHHLATLALPRALPPGGSTVFEYEVDSKQTPGRQHFRRLFVEDEVSTNLSVRFEPPIPGQPVSFGSWTDIGPHQMEFRESLTASRWGLVQKTLEGVVGGMVLGFTWNQSHEPLA